MNADNDNGPLGKIYTLSEAAEYLRLTNRGVAKIAKAHGLCMIRGRDILLTDTDIEQIKEVLRCPSNSSSGKTHQTGGSVVPLPDSGFTRLLERATENSLKRSSTK